MKGWRENEIENRDLMAPCGLYCGACGVYIATRDGNEKFRSVMANLYGTPTEETQCLGCMQPDGTGMIYEYCRSCTIRDCVKEKGWYSCHQCHEWPCSRVENFPYVTGIRVMKRTIPIWREKAALHGHEKGSIEWARGECARYHCSSCGYPLFRGAQRCRNCARPLADELDGSL